MTKEVYEGMTLAKLKEVAKELGIKNISKYKKGELIEVILKHGVNSIEKDGVILKEKIAPKVKDNYSSNNNNRNYYNNNNNNSNNNLNGDRNFNQAQVVSGILEIQENNSFGFLRGKNCLSSSEDVYVSPAQIRSLKL